MKWILNVAYLTLAFTAALSAVLWAETTEPAYTLSYTPENPTTKDVITLKFAGTWPDNRPPYKLKVTLEGKNIRVDMLLPGAEDGKVPVGKTIKTPWQGTATVGPLAAGTYSIYVRGVSYTQTGGYVRIGEIKVEAAPTGQTNPVPEAEKKPADGTVTEPLDYLKQGVGVVLMDDMLAREFELRTGRCGTVLAYDSPGHAGMVLVSWPFFGRGDNAACQDAEGMPLAYPIHSAVWIDTKTVPLAVHFDQRGTLSQGEGGCFLLKTEEGPVYNLLGAKLLNEQIGPNGQFHVEDHVRVQGLLQVTGCRSVLASLSPKQKGDVYYPILLLCPPPEPKPCGPCPGDKLLVDAGHNQVWLYRDTKCPGGKHTLTGTTTVGLVTSYRTALEVKVTPEPGIGGTWKASLSVDQTSSGQWTVVKVYVDVNGIDLTKIPAGEKTLVAKVFFITNK